MKFFFKNDVEQKMFLEAHSEKSFALIVCGK
jgi:hypothetical protein